MEKIILFEDRNFQGRSVECSSDRPDFQSQLSRCNSVRVESGCFMLYERPNFQGQQFFLKRGDYPDMQSEGFSTSIKSCRMIPPHRGTYRIKIYEKEDHRGNMVELTEDSPQVMDQLRSPDMLSCSVLDGFGEEAAELEGILDTSITVPYDVQGCTSRLESSI
ncbi:gamma-crystallin B-like [Macrochelys suwanniensis]